MALVIVSAGPMINEDENLIEIPLNWGESVDEIMNQLSDFSLGVFAAISYEPDRGSLVRGTAHWILSHGCPL